MVPLGRQEFMKQILEINAAAQHVGPAAKIHPFPLKRPTCLGVLAFAQGAAPNDNSRTSRPGQWGLSLYRSVLGGI